MDVQSEAGAGRQQGEEKLANQFLYADTQAQSWAETVPVESTTAGMPPADEIQLMGHVLIVEDNLVNLNVAKKMLLRLGLTCDVAADGLAALSAIDHQQYDLVLMDCQMPRMDGYEATRAIRLREGTRGLAHLPVIAMTANAMQGDREKCLDAGMDDYLSKPVMPATLRLMLSRWLPHDEPAVRQAESRVIEPDQAIGRRSVPASVYAADGDQSAVEVDRAVLEELYEVMDDDFGDLLISYLEAAPGLIREIEAGILDGDAQQVILPAHSLKSSSANVGAMKLSALANRLELAARQGDLAAITGAFEQLNQSFDTAGSVLRKACEQGLN
jgi:CheY-like chemotaxis protein/HPt (histidine-containing phosphotransfer) domain-containing protein